MAACVYYHLIYSCKCEVQLLAHHGLENRLRRQNDYLGSQGKPTWLVSEQDSSNERLPQPSKTPSPSSHYITVKFPPEPMPSVSRKRPWYTEDKARSESALAASKALIWLVWDRRHLGGPETYLPALSKAAPFLHDNTPQEQLPRDRLSRKDNITSIQ